MQAIWSSAWGCLSDQMEGSRLPLDLFSKNKCVLWPLNPPSALHRALSKTTGESESTNLWVQHVELFVVHPCWSTAACRGSIPLMGRNSLISGHLCSETSCLWKNMLSTLAEIFISLFAFSTFSLQLYSLLHFSLDFSFISIRGRPTIFKGWYNNYIFSRISPHLNPSTE